MPMQGPATKDSQWTSILKLPLSKLQAAKWLRLARQSLFDEHRLWRPVPIQARNNRLCHSQPCSLPLMLQNLQLWRQLLCLRRVQLQELPAKVSLAVKSAPTARVVLHQHHELRTWFFRQERKKPAVRHPLICGQFLGRGPKQKLVVAAHHDTTVNCHNHLKYKLDRTNTWKHKKEQTKWPEWGFCQSQKQINKKQINNNKTE